MGQGREIKKKKKKEIAIKLHEVHISRLCDWRLILVCPVWKLCPEHTFWWNDFLTLLVDLEELTANRLENSPKRLRRNLANRSFLSLYCERTWVEDTDKWGISIVLSLEILGALWLTAFSLLLFSSCLLVSWDHICIHFPCNVNKSRTLICFFQCHPALPPIRRHRLQSHQEQPPNHLFPSRPRAARSLPRMHTWMGMDRGEISSVSLDLATPQRAWTVWRH